VFNRLKPTKIVFKEIASCKPSKLYIASDGVRKSNLEDEKNVLKVRDYIINNINWDCEVKTLFRENNLGCKYAVSSAIDWFFDNEKMGIILEDDCLPSQSFFYYCKEMLVRYENDLRFWHINGSQFQDGIKRGEDSYYLSKFPHIWGWATWSNRWKYYDVEMKNYDFFIKEKIMNNIFNDEVSRNYWSDIFLRGYQGRTDAWDYQWAYTCFLNSGISVTPNVNLIENIGFGADATHTFNMTSKLANIKSHNISFPLSHPKFLIINDEADNYVKKNIFKKTNLIERFFNKFKLLILNWFIN
jgi:hypothetical protein